MTLWQKMLSKKLAQEREELNNRLDVGEKTKLRKLLEVLKQPRQQAK